MALYPSRENYLKIIYLLHQKYGGVREYEIAREMGYSKASVCHMVKILSEQGYVSVAENNVCLTSSGLTRAQMIQERYLIIRKFLISVLKVKISSAEQDACLMEHTVCDETIAALKGLLDERGVDIYG